MNTSVQTQQPPKRALVHVEPPVREFRGRGLTSAALAPRSRALQCPFKTEPSAARALPRLPPRARGGGATPSPSRRQPRNGIKKPRTPRRRATFVRISEVRFAQRVFHGCLTRKRRSAARITEALSAPPAGLEFLRKLVFSKLLPKRDSVELNAVDLFYWKRITFPELPEQ